MKHIFFLLAHKNLDQVVEMVKFISDDFDVLVHIDKKTIINSEMQCLLNQFPSNVHLTSKRISIELASIDMIEVISLMFKEMRLLEQRSKTKYGYVGLLSGQCYPIKSSEFIKNKLDSAYPKLIIDIVPIEVAYWLKSVYNRHRFISVHNHMNSRFNGNF